MSSEICRICLETENLHFIFGCGENDIASKIMSICSVKVKQDDGLPKFICEECSQMVDEFLEFKCKIESTQQYLLTSNWMKQNNEVKTVENVSVENVDCIKEEFIQEDEEVNYDTRETNNEGREEKFFQGDRQTEDLAEGNYGTSKTSNEEENKVENIGSDSKQDPKMKQNQCNICGKVLCSVYRLKTHMQLHMGDRPYRCHVCSGGFTSASHLKYHMRLHSREKNHVCTTCKKAFRKKRELNRHLKIHVVEDHICTVCGIRLARAYNLQRHMTIHTGEKKFKCDICGQGYAENCHLKRHRETHTRKNTKNKTTESGNDICEEGVILFELLVNDIPDTQTDEAEGCS